MSELFSFVSPFLSNTELKETHKLLYKGTLRILLILLHDFPEFLCGYHFTLCNMIPIKCIQLRNLVLSAFPKAMRLPDPFLPNLKVDLLPEIRESPRIIADIQTRVVELGLKADADALLAKKNVAGSIASLRGKLKKGDVYMLEAINCLVTYLGIMYIQNNKASNNTPHSGDTTVEIFLLILMDLDTEGIIPT